MNSTRHDELVELISNTLNRWYEIGHRRGVPPAFPDVEAKRIIKHTLKAVVDGELELPGHQLYLKITPYLKRNQEKVLGVLREELRLGDILIVLREEEEDVRPRP